MQRHISELLHAPRKVQQNSEFSADKLRATVAKTNEIICLNLLNKTKGTCDLLSMLAKRLDDLLGFMLASFAQSKDVQAKFVLSNMEISENSLSEIPEHMIPLAVVRHLLFKHRVIVDPRTLKHWPMFASIYESHVLN